MSADALYEAVKGNWWLNLKRASKAQYGMGIRDGVIRAIYKIDSCEVAPDRNPTRYGFCGTKEAD